MEKYANFTNRMINTIKIKTTLSYLFAFAVMYFGVLHGEYLKEWLSSEHPFMALTLDVLAKILLALMPLVACYYIYNENKKLIYCLNHNSPLPLSILRKHGNNVNVKDFNKVELYFVKTVASVAGIIWAIGLCYYLIVN